MKENPNKELIYTYSEVLQAVEDGIDLWEFAKKFKITVIEKCNFLKLLLLCTNNDRNKAEKLLEKLLSNSQKYIEESVKRNEVLNYDTLVLLSKKGFSKIDIMKRFGKTSYSSFSVTLRNLYKKENIDKAKQKKISEAFRKNIDSRKVIFISDAKDEKENGKEIMPQTLTVSPTTETIDTSNDTPLYSEKLILYTIEYLVLQGNKIIDELFDGAIEERVILSSTLTKYIEHTSVSEEAKIKLTEAINERRIGVLMATSEYSGGNKNKNSVDNDIILSQALMLRRHTDKTICIATRDPQTALNSLILGFEIRIPKNILLKKFSDITDVCRNNISYYFDYNIKTNTAIPKNCNCKSVTILDTCVIIDNSSNTASTNRDKILSDTSQLKIIPRIVLDELRGGSKVLDNSIFFNTLFASKCNPTIMIDLDMKMSYIFDDIAILNYAMHYELTTGKEVTILTHDKKFYLEALKYNMRVRYYPSTYMDTFAISEACTEDAKAEKEIECQDVTDDTNDVAEDVLTENNSQDFLETSDKYNPDGIVYHQSVPIHRVSSKPVILNNNKISCIKSAKTMATIELKGHKGYKYYPVELGDFVSFKGDSNLYRLVALSGKNNLESVDIIKLNSSVYS